MTPVRIADMLKKNAQDWDDMHHPLAIFSGGSSTEWFHYNDPDWRPALDDYMAVIRDTQIPMLAVCGSHELVGAAYNGFGAIAHMEDGKSKGVPATDPPTSKRVVEFGTYPLVVLDPKDPVVAKSVKGKVMASLHHADMVVNTSSFTMLFTASTDPAFTNAPNAAKDRCYVQGMRLSTDSRVLYSVQFHPEIEKFWEAGKQTDRGFGRAFLVSFLERSKSFWES